MKPLYKSNKFDKIKEILDNREGILMFLVILLAVIFGAKLVEIQIFKGKEYRENSSKKMLRTVQVEAPRGEIYDRNGILLASSKLGFDIQLYKTKLENSELNDIILKVINIVEKNGDSIDITIPVQNDQFEFSSNKDKNTFFTTYKLDENTSVKECLEKIYTKYELEKYSELEKYKIAQVRYSIAKEGYSLFKPVNIAKNISYNSVLMVEEIKQDLKGTEIRVYPKRYYPNGTLGAHFLGYVSSINGEDYQDLKDKGYGYDSVIGKMGIEETMEPYLKGTDGIKRVEVDSMGIANSEYTHKEPVSGKNVTLTIDWNLQKVAEESLEKVIKEINVGTNGFQQSTGADSGAVVAIDVTSGEVLAIASYPTFDPNEFIGGIKSADWKVLNTNPAMPMFNRAISGMYSPGSTYKMLVGVAGLETGTITVDEQIEDKGIYPFGYNPTCWIYSSKHMTHGLVDISKAIKVSCNYFFYDVGRRTGIEKLVEYSKKFGLGEKTGIELSGESKGKIAGDNPGVKWYLGDTLSAAIGQSYNSYTPIELVNYISTLSNGGNLNKISMVKSVENNNGEKENEFDLLEYIKGYTGVDFKPSKVEIKKENIDAITEGMKSVTSEQGGTSYITFKNSEIEVAGKTGTAQVSSGKENGIFVGFAPIGNPKIAVVAIVEHAGSGVYTASVVKPIMDEYFNISKKSTMIETPKELKDTNIEY